MAEILNKCSARSQGEQRVAQLLESFDDNNLLLAFSVDFIPGCREMDLLLVHLDLGIYIIEIKAVPLSAIQSIAPNEWKFDGRTVTESPLRQAYAQYEGLRSHWDARMRSKLTDAAVCATACLPEISRAEWTRAFPSETYASSIADGILFRDDLIDAETLFRRLEHVMQHPAIRKGRATRAVKREVIQDLRGIFSSIVPQAPTVSDRARLQAIEKQVTKQLLKDFPPDSSAFAYYTGHPGTGKTFRLLAIGLGHAYAGKKVLFACFNKTLASDIRRLLLVSEKLKHVSYPIDSVDIFQLARRSFEMNGYSISVGSTPDDWGSMVVAELRNDSADSAIVDQYDTVLIDEAHDLQDWQLELLSLHAKPFSTICIAVGKGQELYRDDSSATGWLEQMAKGGKIRHHPLRRNFRNTRAQYFSALAFHRAWPDKISHVATVHKEVFSGGKQTGDLLAFERDGEGLTYIPLPALPSEFENNGQQQLDVLAPEYAEIIRRELDEQLKTGGAPVGLLILVPSETSVHAAAARAALEILCTDPGGITFLDYTNDDNRRSLATTSDIRFCTFHSSRGLEGDRVVVFGLETIENLAAQTKVRAENLAFIALSRALFRTTLVVRTYYATKVHPLLKAIVQAGS